MAPMTMMQVSGCRLTVAGELWVLASAWTVNVGAAGAPLSTAEPCVTSAAEGVTPCRAKRCSASMISSSAAGERGTRLKYVLSRSIATTGALNASSEHQEPALITKSGVNL